VETTPGLSPEAVRRVFDSQRQALASCVRLITMRPAAGGAPHSYEFLPWQDVPGTDDRIQLSFTLTPSGKVQKEYDPRTEYFGVRGLYLETSCAENVVKGWSFPAFPGESNARVLVEVWARFRTTEAERKAMLARIREDFTSVCSALPATAQPVSNEQWSAAVTRVLSERGASLDPRVRMSFEAVRNVNPEDALQILENAREQLLVPPLDCLKRGTRTKTP
jgi:hypothetical protein